MIKNSEPLSMTEAQEYFDVKGEQGAKAHTFVKKFSNLNVKDSKEMRKKLNELNFVKLNDFQIVKIIELLPENSEEINKIFTEVNLDEDETKKILDIVKQFK
jgi:DNA-directed RNA polymerase subunit F